MMKEERKTFSPRETVISKEYESNQRLLSKMKEVKKLKLETRVALARNLGALFKSVKVKNGALSLSQLFRQAFSEAIAESLLKKRKSLIILEDEEIGDNEQNKLKAKVHQYVELMETMVRLISSDDEKAGWNQAFYKLIDNTEFKPRASGVKYLQNRAFSTTKKALEKICDNVINQVDLDWMNEILKIYPVGAIGAPTQVTSLYSSKWSPEYTDLELTPELNYCLAPTAQIANYVSKIDPKIKTISLRIKKDAPDVEVALREAITEKLINYDFRIDLSEDFYRDSNDIKKLEMFFEKHGHDGLQRDAYIRHRVDLSIRKDVTDSQWKCALCLREHKVYGPDNGWEGERFEDNIFYEITNKLGEPAFSIFHLSYDDAYALLAIRDSDSFCDEDEEEYTCFLADPFWVGAFGSLLEGVFAEKEIFFADSDEINQFDECLFSLIEKGTKLTATLQPELANSQTRDLPYSYAPCGTLANIILSNIAYADEAHRIDNLLIQDAKSKLALLKSFLDEKEEKFESALDNFFSEDPSTENKG